MGLHRGVSRRRNSCGPRSESPLAWKQAARFGHTIERPTQRPWGRGGAERPIAPGNLSCPLPPWDTTFPGAFFLRLSRSSLTPCDGCRYLDSAHGAFTAGTKRHTLSLSISAKQGGRPSFECPLRRVYCCISYGVIGYSLSSRDRAWGGSHPSPVQRHTRGSVWDPASTQGTVRRD